MTAHPTEKVNNLDLYTSLPRGHDRSTEVSRICQGNATTIKGIASKITKASQLYRDLQVDIGVQDYLVEQEYKSQEEADKLLGYFQRDSDKIFKLLSTMKSKILKLNADHPSLVYMGDNDSEILRRLDIRYKRIQEDQKQEDVEEIPAEIPVHVDDTADEDIPVQYYEDNEETPVPATPDKHTPTPPAKSSCLEDRVLIKFLEREIPAERFEELRTMAHMAATAMRE